MANKKKELIDSKKEAALQDLEAFITLVHPNRVLGHVHKELIQWWTRPQAKSHQLVLLPRDHQKSAMIAYRVAWEITKNPAIRILYISSTSKLAIKQLKFIKDILTSKTYLTYWPEMVNVEEGKRSKWTETEIHVDHPAREDELIRDPTVFTAGLTTTITGMHCDIAVLDDVVVDETAYDEAGRNKVRDQVSYLASIAGTDGRLWAVGTRYHPKDLYGDMYSMNYDVYDDEGNVIMTEPLYEVYERQVEDQGDGTGQFLWPRQQRSDGKWFGFDRNILSKKKAQYADLVKFRAQYYNNPNDAGSSAIKSSMFQYYNKSLLNQRSGKWYYGASRLNVFASIDFAFSLRKEADYTALVVVGIDRENNYYILDIERFKTNLISDYFDRILRTHMKWGYNKLRAEVTQAQSMIVKDIKENYIRRYGLALSIDDNNPKKKAKEERIEAALQPKYYNKQMWHFLGGNCELLEEELVNQRPQHDDIKDALASCMEIMVAPSFIGNNTVSHERKSQVSFNTRFGGY